jgi:uncharacterized protein (DUF2147 family)
MTSSTLLKVVVCITLVAGLFTHHAAFALESESPVGRWQTYDDHTHAPRGMIRIYEEDGKLFGHIERAAEKKNERDICAVCTDDRHGKPIDGLVIIRNMERSAEQPLEWSGGDILDPNTGKLYRFKMRVEDHGAKLVVRGFLGLSLIGRTQTWMRIP